MKLLEKIKSCSTSVKIALIFAITMLVSSYLMAGHENAGVFMILLIGLYVSVANLQENKPSCKKSRDTA